MTPVRLKPSTPRSRIKHSTTDPLRSHIMSNIRDIDQSETLSCNYSESGSIDQMLCKELYFSSGDYNVQKSRAGWVALVEVLKRNVITNCMK